MPYYHFRASRPAEARTLPKACPTPQKRHVTGVTGPPKGNADRESPIGKAIRKLTLPPIVSSTRGTTAIDELLKACAPATFGKKGEEVLDESYRKAVKLDSNQFSTSFNPYEVGIIDAIAQSLLPGIARPFSDGNLYEEHLGVIAELYKLNVRLRPDLLSPLLAAQACFGLFFFGICADR